MILPYVVESNYQVSRLFWNKRMRDQIQRANYVGLMVENVSPIKKLPGEH